MCFVRQIQPLCLGSHAAYTSLSAFSQKVDGMGSSLQWEETR